MEGPVADAGTKKGINLQKFVGRRIIDVKTLGKELFLIFDLDVCLRYDNTSVLKIASPRSCSSSSGWNPQDALSHVWLRSLQPEEL